MNMRMSVAQTQIYAGKTKTRGYTFVIPSRGLRFVLSTWKDVWCGSATAQLQWNLFCFISIFYQKPFYSTEPLGIQLEITDIPLEMCPQIWCHISTGIKIAFIWVKPNLHCSLYFFFQAAVGEGHLNTLKKLSLGKILLFELCSRIWA